MRIAIAGFGVVAQALARMLDARRDDLYRAHGLKPRIVGVTDSRGAAVDPGGLSIRDLLDAKQRGASVADLGRGALAAGDALAAESQADVLVEATPSDYGDVRPANQRIMAAFRRGTHVISVNKAPLALAFSALDELARHNDAEFRYSGTVGAGTPMLAMAEQCARGDEIISIRAILNGTTNFILCRMHEQGQSFDEALGEAQQRGYAETDPTADVDGIDAAAKITILANAVLRRHVTLPDVAREGIRGVTVAQLADAAGRGKRVKLIGECGEALRVAPLEVDAGGPLDVSETRNALSVRLRYGDEVTLTGRGAGGDETATAVVRDLVDIWHVAGSRS